MDVKKLVTHQAKWHKSCYLKFNDTKLQRARKREQEKRHDNNNDDSTTLQSQSCLQRQSMDKKKCIFCTKDGGDLHEFRTFDADDNVRRMATNVEDTAPLTRTDGGWKMRLEIGYG